MLSHTSNEHDCIEEKHRITNHEAMNQEKHEVNEQRSGHVDMGHGDALRPLSHLIL